MVSDLSAGIGDSPDLLAAGVRFEQTGIFVSRVDAGPVKPAGAGDTANLRRWKPIRQTRHYSVQPYHKAADQRISSATSRGDTSDTAQPPELEAALNSIHADQNGVQEIPAPV